MEQRDGLLISLCMIVKHEASTIESTIASIRSIVSEVVVGVDKSSSDGTREIVERLGCKVISTNLSAELATKSSSDDDSDWGFSKARNKVFEAANPDAWRIVLDGHEIVKDAELFAAKIREAATKDKDCVDVTVWFEPASDGIPQTIFDSTRAMAPHIRYANPQHNVAVVKRRYSARDVIIEHRKCDQATEARAERNAQRSDSNIAGFEQAVIDHPQNSRSWFYLATAYKENARFEDAIKTYDECLKHSRWNEERWHSRMDKGHCLVILGRLEEARASYVMAIDEHRVRAEAYYQLGDLAYKQQRFGEAEVWLEKCVTMPMPSCRLFLNPRIYMTMRHDSLSMVYHHLGKYSLAVEQAEIALKAAPNKRIEKNLLLWKGWLSGGKQRKSPIDICSHKRSGTHFLMATLWENFELPDVEVKTVIPKGRLFVDIDGNKIMPGEEATIPWGGLWLTHGMFDAQADVNRTIYVVRNPISALMSFWKFDDPLLQGEASNNSIEVWESRVKHWYRQSLSYLRSKCMIIRYEDLLGAGHNEILRMIELKYGLKRKHDEFIRFEKRVGWYSDKKPIQPSDPPEILLNAIAKIIPRGFLGYSE